MKLLAKQQALRAYLAGYTIVYDDKGKFKQVNQNTRLNASNEYYVLDYASLEECVDYCLRN